MVEPASVGSISSAASAGNRCHGKLVAAHDHQICRESFAQRRPTSRSSPLNSLSDPNTKALRRCISDALKHRQGARLKLRSRVMAASRDMLLAGATHAEIQRSLTRVVDDHPELWRLDRVSLLNGQRESVVLMQYILECATEAGAPEEPLTTPR